eukprot:scaffold141_cov410-Prasinococcus_capsulatus_cf.AAC.6
MAFSVSARLSTKQTTTASTATARKAATLKPVVVAPKGSSIRLAAHRRAARVGLTASRPTPVSRHRSVRQTTQCSYEAGIGLYGQKAGMTTWFDDNGDAVACTIIALPVCSLCTCSAWSQSCRCQSKPKLRSGPLLTTLCGARMVMW